MKLYLLDLLSADSLICIKVPKRGVFTLIMTLQLLIFHLSDYHSLDGLQQGLPRVHEKRALEVKAVAISKGHNELTHSRWVLLTLRQSRIVWHDKQGETVSAWVEMENGRACVRSNNEGFGERRGHG